MARPQLRISVPKPCSENWNAMTPQAKGRFCESCATTVTDFSQFSDAQLKAYFLQSSGKTCGRFSSAQLDKPIFLDESRKPNFLVKAFASFVLFSGFASTVLAQSNSENRGTTHQLIQRIQGKKHETVAKQPEKVSGDSLVISGTVIDKPTNTGLPGAIVIIKGTKVGTNTDANGNFALMIPDTLQLENFSIEVLYVGFKTKEVQLERNQLVKNLKIYLDNSDVILKGEVLVIQRRSLFQSIWWKTKNLFRKDD